MLPKMPISTGPMYAVMQPNEQYIDVLKRRKEIIINLCQALESYLIFDIDVALETANDPIPTFPRYTPEMLVQATNRKNELATQLEQMENSLDQMPDMLKAYCETMAILPIRNQLKDQEEYINQIQKGLEELEGEENSQSAT